MLRLWIELSVYHSWWGLYSRTCICELHWLCWPTESSSATTEACEALAADKGWVVGDRSCHPEPEFRVSAHTKVEHSRGKSCVWILICLGRNQVISPLGLGFANSFTFCKSLFSACCCMTIKDTGNYVSQWHHRQLTNEHYTFHVNIKPMDLPSVFVPLCFVIILLLLPRSFTLDSYYVMTAI